MIPQVSLLYCELEIHTALRTFTIAHNAVRLSNVLRLTQSQSAFCCICDVTLKAHVFKIWWPGVTFWWRQTTESHRSELGSSPSCCCCCRSTLWGLHPQHKWQVSIH